jgi:hypothetical protein
MVGFEMFCERCGKRYGNKEATAGGSLPLSKRLLKAVGVSSSAPQAPPDEPVLRFCLACRGYSCPECWNDAAGFCQTCVPVEEPIAEMPAIEIPALEPPAPAITFLDPDVPPYLQMLAEQEDPGVDPAAAAAVDPMAPFEAGPVAADEPAIPGFEAAPWDVEVEAVVESESRTGAAPVIAETAAVAAQDVVETAEPVEASGMAALAAEVPEVAEVPDVAEVLDVAEGVEGVGVEAVETAAVVAAETAGPAPVAAVAEASAMDERPIELVFGDEEEARDGDPEMAWDWDFIAETEAAPIDMPEPVMPPLAATTEAESPEPGVLVDAPVVPPTPEVLPPPVYRPLPPLGPILPPPPPAGATGTPHIEFDLLETPPAFVIAPPQNQPLMRPTLPAGLFDGPAPQIRPCRQCELPVSAKARFCRRCGSAQS